jgi:hypothetical protein
MKYLQTAFSTILDQEALHKELECILQVLEEHGVSNMDILFGYAWDLEYKNWTPFSISLTEVFSEIRKAEELSSGEFGADDLYLILNGLEMEILFCHESDIHIDYNNKNEIIEKILHNWEVQGILNIEKQNS